MATTNVSVKKDEVRDFFEALEKVSHFEPREPAKQLFDLGLIIFEKGSRLSAEDIFQFLPEGKGALYIINDPNSYEGFLEKLVMTLREGMWLVVDCQADPAPQIIQALKQLSDSNEFTLGYFEEKELFNMKLSQKSRIVFCLKNDFLEEKITHPYFMSLFGPILRIK